VALLQMIFISLVFLIPTWDFFDSILGIREIESEMMNVRFGTSFWGNSSVVDMMDWKALSIYVDIGTTDCVNLM